MAEFENKNIGPGAFLKAVRTTEIRQVLDYQCVLLRGGQSLTKDKQDPELIRGILLGMTFERTGGGEAAPIIEELVRQYRWRMDAALAEYERQMKGER